MIQDSPKKKHILIVGFGYVGQKLAQILFNEGHIVSALRRSETISDYASVNSVDVTCKESMNTVLVSDLDVIIYTVSADTQSEESYKSAYVTGVENCRTIIERAKNENLRFIFTSSTGVYGQDDGSEVNEESETVPSSFTGEILLQGERAALSLPCKSNIVRLSGIYGPERNYLIRKVLSGEAISVNPQAYTNRIHRDDAAAILKWVSEHENPSKIYLGVDDAQATQEEVLEYLSKRLGVSKPTFNSQFRQGLNKRCSNKLSKSQGFTLLYPSYKEGYESLLMQYSR